MSIHFFCINIDIMLKKESGVWMKLKAILIWHGESRQKNNEIINFYSYLTPTLHTFVSGKTELPRAGHIDAGPHIGSHPIGKSSVNKATVSASQV